MKNTAKIITATAVLAAICLIISAALACTNQLTQAKISARNAEETSKAMKRICKAEDYRKKTVVYKNISYTYYTAETAGTTEGYIFTTEQNGYGGAVSVMTGVDMQGQILAVEILDVSSETVGLGQNAAKSEFTNQFKEKSGALQVSKSAKGDEIQALTGATITSNAITGAVNTALELYKTVKGA